MVSQVGSGASFYEGEGDKNPLIFHNSHDLNDNYLCKLMKLT